MNSLATVVFSSGAAGGLVAVLIHILIIALIIGLILWVLTFIPIPEPFGQVIRVLCIVIGAILIIVALLSLL